MRTKVILSITWVIIIVLGIFIYFLWTGVRNAESELIVKEVNLTAKTEQLGAMREKHEKLSIELQERDKEVRLLFVGIVDEKVDNFLKQTGFSLTPELVYNTRVDTKNLEKMSTAIVENTAIPWVENGHFKGILTFSGEVKLDPQLFVADLSYTPHTELEAYQNVIRGSLQEGDHILTINWRIGEHGWFQTFAVVSRDGKLKFEPMMYFTTGPSEVQGGAGKKLTETTITWEGNIINNLGMKAITWKAGATFKADGANILGNPYGGFDYAITHLPLWHIRDKRFSCSDKTKLLLDNKSVETQVAMFTLTWATGFTDVEVPFNGTTIRLKDTGTSGAILQKLIELRGDGSAWSHGEHIPSE